MVREGPRLVRELVNLGVTFTQERDNFDLWKEGGHSRNRIIHARDLTGREIEKALISRVKENPRIKTYENHLAIDLMIHSQKRCMGALILNSSTGEIEPFYSKVTLLATGGIGQVYLYTTNPRIATGDGIAMAYRAGALIANMEFVQFHPTSLFVRKDEARSFLISEAVRGEGGILRTLQGIPFMERYSERGNLASRDIVARAIDSELKKRGDEHLLLDITHLPARRIRERFPNIYKTCLDYGIDITIEPIPVVPAAHYICGGVLTDINGKTSIAGLYAAGETACTGVHGANRLASNSLLEALVFSERSFRSSMKYILKIKRAEGEESRVPKFSLTKPEAIVLSHTRDEIRRLLWDYVGIVRTTQRLERARREISMIKEEVDGLLKNSAMTSELIELRNMTTIAELIIQCALARKESRGLHFNSNYPDRDDRNWRKNTLLKRQ